MQKQVLFYLLPDNEQTAIAPAHLHFICLAIVDLYRQRKKIMVIADDQDQAHLIDEYLWQFDPDSFVAHHLSGELATGGSPVEISWRNNPKQGNIPPNFVVVNAATVMPEGTQNNRQIIEFVPVEETLKQQARDRFKQYRQQGFNATTQPWQPQHA